MPKGRPPKQPKLPPHVFVVKATGNWFVRRSFPTFEKYKSGKPVYTQLVRRCDPHTAERAKEVYEEILDLREELRKQSVAPNTIEGFFATFLASKSGKVGVRTHEDYESLVDRYIKGTSFGRSPLEMATTLNVQTFYDELQADGVSGAMLRKLHRLMSMAFAKAVLWEQLPKNPCSRGSIELPRADEPEIEYYDRRDARVFQKTCLANPEKYLALALALDAALRPGELLGLRWKDVDFRHNRIHIRKVVSFLRSGGFIIKDPKTKKSRRTLDVNPVIIEELRKHRKRLDAEITAAEQRVKDPLAIDHSNARKGHRYEERKLRRKLAKEYLHNIAELDLVFPSNTGLPQAASNVGKREMADAAKAAGVNKISLYGLRHTWATLALEAGVDIKTVSEFLGHADIAITLKHYAHVLPTMKSRATRAMSKALY
jgi:integrase